MKLHWGLLLLLPVAVQAAELDTLAANPALSVREVLDKAVERNPQRYVLQAMDGEVQARYKSARGALPLAPAVSLRHQNDAVGSGRGEREWEAELELPVWLPGQRTARENVAQGAQGELATSQDGLRLQLAGVLRDAIWDVGMNEANVDLSGLRLKTAEALQNDVKRRHQAGELAKTDLMLAENETLQARSALLRAQAELRHAQHRYRQLTGLGEIPANAQEIQSEQVGLSEQHPLLREAEAKIALAQNERDLVRLERRENPQLMLGARSQRGAFDDHYNSSVGMKIRIPLESEVRSAPMLAAVESNLAKVMSERERTRYMMETAIHEAEHNLEVTKAELELATQQHALARENQRLAQKAFDLGETDLVHLMRMQAQAYEAERALASRKIQLQWDIARYNQAIGVLP
jgi:outer membrane protein TolC